MTTPIGGFEFGFWSIGIAMLLSGKHVVLDGLRPIEAAQGAGVSPPAAYKWLRRYNAFHGKVRGTFP